MKQFLIISGIIIGASLSPAKAIAATFSQIIVYGDSLSDLGRAAAATNGQIPPYSGIAGGGRFSNGKLWVEYLADKLGILSNPNTNFAIGGATTGAQNTLPIPLPAGIGVQTEISDSLASNPSFLSDPAALYVIWAGANDYLGSGITDPTIPITNLTNEIATLIQAGAKNILVPNLPSLGELPTTRNTPFSQSLNTLTQFHNAGLAQSIAILKNNSLDVNLRLLDINTLFNTVVTSPSQFGFDNVTDGCILVGCTNPDTYAFWDTIHPTTATHELISDLAIQTLEVPEPTTVLGSLAALSIGVSLKRKTRSSLSSTKKRVTTRV